MKTCLACMLVLAACSTAPSPGEAPPDAPASESVANGGSIVMFSEPEGAGFVAEVYASATPDQLVLPAYGDGHCDIVPPAGPFATVVDRGLGASLVASDGVTTLTAADSPDYTLGIAEGLLPDVDHDGTIHFYGVGDAGHPSSATWQLASDAGPIATIAIPDQVSQKEITFVVAAGDATVHFGGGTNAQFLEIDAGGAGGTAACYPPSGTTSFTIPQDVVTTVAGTDHLINVNVFAKNRTLVTIGGRGVVVIGQSQNLD